MANTNLSVQTILNLCFDQPNGGIKVGKNSNPNAFTQFSEQEIFNQVFNLADQRLKWF